jgi:hypothetical protein
MHVRPRLAALTLASVLAGVTACDLAPVAAPTTSATTTTPTPARGVAALELLGTLQVKGRGPRTGYDREEKFGSAWTDVDRNGCDTRNDILKRDLTGETFRRGTRDCVVLTGTLDDPYTGRTIAFTKAEASAVQIEHVVALSDAWQKGAAGWDRTTRVAFANDPLNLLAVDGPTNQRKGNSDAASWLPPDTSFRCAYVARQIAVKHRYGVHVTSAERDAMGRVLRRCPDEPAPGLPQDR